MYVICYLSEENQNPDFFTILIINNKGFFMVLLFSFKVADPKYISFFFFFRIYFVMGVS